MLAYNLYTTWPILARLDARLDVCAEGSRRKASSAALYCGAAAGLLHAADAYLDITHWLRPQPEGSAGSEDAGAWHCSRCH